MPYLPIQRSINWNTRSYGSAATARQRSCNGISTVKSSPFRGNRHYNRANAFWQGDAMRARLITPLLLGGIILSLQAQTTPVAQISGVVQDSSGAAIPGAQVTVANTDTSAVRIAVSGPDG